MANPQWKLEQRICDAALSHGEEIARLNGFDNGPVDPFRIIESEGDLIHAEGGDFRDCFDGRLSFHDSRFLLIYNIRYNTWPHNSTHHPKVRFTVAHELGHFYLDRHREFLVNRRKPIESFTEFESINKIERQADAFATGLLMPRYLVGSRVNCEPDVTISTIKDIARDFDVSLTSMMVRWTQLSHFPCATLCIRNGRIQWGFVAEAFRRCKLWKAQRGNTLTSTNALEFLKVDESLSYFREGSGIGHANQWLEGECELIDVQEYFVVIPYSQCVMVFIIANEEDLPDNWEDDF